MVRLPTLQILTTNTKQMESNEIPKGCKPFNLEAAMNGAEIVTRDGRPVKFGAYNEDAQNDNVIIGWIGKDVFSWDINGKRLPFGRSDYDLFLKSRTVTKWVNVYKFEDGSFKVGVDLYDNEWTAKLCTVNIPNYHSTIQIQIED